MRDRRSPEVAAWEARGTYRELAGHSIFSIEIPAARGEQLEPLLVIHGFPTSSFDFAHVVGELAQQRRVLLVDMLGYGFSDKPDVAYTLDKEADVIAAFTDDIGLSEVALLTHDLGDSVGGELLARQLEGRWSTQVTRRVITNGSIYIEMAHLSVGQEVLLSLPDERLPADAAIDEEALRVSLAATFSPGAPVGDADLSAMSELVAVHQGHLLLPRTIRYIEERRRNERRFTGAIESHPSPLAVVWGEDDPIAVVGMAHRLHEVRPDAPLAILDHVGHYPMIESPKRFAAAVTAGLA
jgi:pimeloyl-ACP methyl ester carboxylesterase